VCLASLWHRVTTQAYQFETVWCWSSSSHPCEGCAAGRHHIIPSCFRSAEAKALLLRHCAVVYTVFCLQQLINDGVCCMQVSDQCVKLVKAGWFDVQKEPSGVSTLTNPKVRSQGTSACPHPCITVGGRESIKIPVWCGSINSTVCFGKAASGHHMLCELAMPICGVFRNQVQVRNIGRKSKWLVQLAPSGRERVS